MELQSTQQQKREDKKRDWSFPTAVLVFLACLAVLALAGCASASLDKSVAQCYALGGSPSWTTAESVQKFSCDMPGTRMARAS